MHSKWFGYVGIRRRRRIDRKDYIRFVIDFCSQLQKMDRRDIRSMFEKISGIECEASANRRNMSAYN